MKNIRYILSALLGICLILSGCQNLTEPAGSTLPTVETGDALEITSHSATITGKYNPGAQTDLLLIFRFRRFI